MSFCIVHLGPPRQRGSLGSGFLFRASLKRQVLRSRVESLGLVSYSLTAARVWNVESEPVPSASLFLVKDCMDKNETVTETPAGRMHACVCVTAETARISKEERNRERERARRRG